MAVHWLKALCVLNNLLLAMFVQILLVTLFWAHTPLCLFEDSQYYVPCTQCVHAHFPAPFQQAVLL